MKIQSEFVPVGTIVAYGGEVKDRYIELENAGWLVCDGRELERGHYSELYESIQSAFGSANEALFNLPDLRGLFFRVVSGNSNVDPDAAGRGQLAAGSNSGNAVGSYQKYATGVPKLPFRATITNNVIEDRSVDLGCNTSTSARPGELTAGGNTTGSGGDLETRPKNKYVYFLIKHSRLDKYKEEVRLPVGCIIPFAGRPNLSIEAQFIRCDGGTVPGPGKFKALFEAIGDAHGKVGNDFDLPDYRGYFLRGVDTQSAEFRRDPDAELRTAPFPKRPAGDGGNRGNRVGSVQDDATAYPLTQGFFTKIPRLPSSEGNQTINGLEKKAYEWNASSVDCKVTESGGDTETRPTNISVDWYIKFERD